MLTIAIPKGRILEEANSLMIKSGIINEEVKEGRKLILDDQVDDIRFILAKPQDVPTYVKYGVADVGIVGKDVLLEWGEGLYELMDLKIGLCRISICGKPDKTCDRGEMPRIATKYPKIASTYFREKGQQVEIIKLNGSVELAPLLGLSHYIVDIVSTGRTLKENGLVELEQIANISCRLIVNQATYHLKNTVIEELVNKLEDGVRG
ncbi:MAG: phosphoribosyltransferase [Clostridia bacterium]|jgi:ATP phosphoribosyltransferase|nr:phosphoribosyltransferase [Clostridia bacterium]MDN5322064.1 phosphoribosyltransferase [Clostridia bacterium]